MRRVMAALGLSRIERRWRHEIVLKRSSNSDSNAAKEGSSTVFIVPTATCVERHVSSNPSSPDRPCEPALRKNAACATVPRL
eukprot:309855-Pyramimonas_sp.AAC.1